MSGGPLDGRDAAELLALAGPAIRRLAENGGLTVAQRRAVERAVAAARTHRDAGHHEVTTVDAEDAPARSSWCTTAEAGRRLGLTRWAVRKACKRGDLVSRQDTARGPLVIDEQSIARFEALRGA